jgi:hypothetical protein
MVVESFVRFEDCASCSSCWEWDVGEDPLEELELSSMFNGRFSGLLRFGE